MTVTGVIVYNQNWFLANVDYNQSVTATDVTLYPVPIVTWSSSSGDGTGYGDGSETRVSGNPALADGKLVPPTHASLDGKKNVKGRVDQRPLLREQLVLLEADFTF